MAAEMGRRQGRHGQKSSFAVTCSLLSQYIKEKGSIANLGLSVAPPPPDASKGKPEESRPPTTMMLLPGGEREDQEEPHENVMELFPQRAGFGPSVTDLGAEEKAPCASDVREQKRAQLTIFYGGKVLVFDSFPADEAKHLMQLASKGTSTMQNSSYMPPSTLAAIVDHPTGLSNQDPELVTTPVSNSVNLKNPAQPGVSDLPIARKSSLQWFLKKRKDRINAKSPYQVTSSPPSPDHVKPEEDKSWISLGK